MIETEILTWLLAGPLWGLYAGLAAIGVGALCLAAALQPPRRPR